jgi:putative ABC transport system permease protein
VSVVSLVAGAFVILNAFLMNLGERRRQLAILRALGATQGQITLLLLREAVWLGISGTVLGIGVGALLAVVALRLAAGLMGLSGREVTWSIEPFLVAIILGPGMCVAAAFLPARRAGQTPPLTDLMPRRHGREPGLSHWLGYLGLVLWPAPMALELASHLGWVSPRATPFLLGATTLLALAGSGLLIPLLLPPLLRFVGLLFRPLFGTIGRLAVRHLDRHQSRTALTVGVLTIAVVFVLSFGTTLLNRLDDIRHWYERFAYGDFYLRSAFPDLTTLVTGAALPEAMEAELESLDGVARVDRINGALTHIGSQPALVMAMTLSTDRPLPFELVAGEPDLAAQRLAEGDVLLGTGLARRLRLGIGDAIEFGTPHGPRSRRIAALIQDYSAGGMVLVMEEGAARRLFDLKGVLCYVLTARPGAEPDLAERLGAFCRERGLLLDSKRDIRTWFARKIEGMVTLCWCLLALVFVVASLGITNSLTMNLLEQTREIAVLRAIGMRRGQVRALLLCEALAIGLVSLGPGLILGIGWSYLMHWPKNPTLGRMVNFQVSFWFLAGCCIAALVVPIFAALYPGQRAARLEVIQALRYE